MNTSLNCMCESEWEKIICPSLITTTRQTIPSQNVDYIKGYMSNWTEFVPIDSLHLYHLKCVCEKCALIFGADYDHSIKSILSNIITKAKQKEIKIDNQHIMCHFISYFLSYRFNQKQTMKKNSLQSPDRSRKNWRNARTKDNTFAAQVSAIYEIHFL